MSAPLKSLLYIVLVLPVQVVHAQSSEAMNCAAELDSTVASASYGNFEPQLIEHRFATLEKICPGFAQLAHNQGVLAAEDGRIPQAIVHFRRALEKDARAADTHRQLQDIFEYRAATAYARALDTPLIVDEPVWVLQDSTLRNSEPRQRFPEHKSLRDIATIEYELYAWWQAQQTWKGVRQHYIDGYQDEAIKQSRQRYQGKSWSDIQREIAFTESDVVVVLSDSQEARSLLLMRLVGTRWKIYQETQF